VTAGDGTDLTGQAQAAVEAFMASRPGDPGRVTLRLLTAADQGEFLGLAAASADLHHPWMSLAATPPEFQAYLRRFDHVTAEGLLVCLRATGAIAVTRRCRRGPQRWCASPARQTRGSSPGSTG
jgi:ribosomal-protein-alanine N-acetyltransferase